MLLLIKMTESIVDEQVAANHIFVKSHITCTHFLCARQKTSAALVADFISSDDSLQLNIATLFPCEPRVTTNNTIQPSLTD